MNERITSRENRFGPFTKSAAGDLGSEIYRPDLQTTRIDKKRTAAANLDRMRNFIADALWDVSAQLNAFPLFNGGQFLYEHADVGCWWPLSSAEVQAKLASVANEKEDGPLSHFHYY